MKLWKTALVEVHEIEFSKLNPGDKVYYTLKSDTGTNESDYLHGPFIVGFTNGKHSVINSSGIDIPIGYFINSVIWYIISQ